MLSLHEEDLGLVRRMLSGDRTAFDAFLDFSYPRLYRFALPRVRSNQDAADEIVQQALYRAIEGLEGYRGEASLLTWLMTICRHEVTKYCKRNPGDHLRSELLEDVDEIRSALESLTGMRAESPEDVLQRKEVARLVRLVLDMLPIHYGTVLEWKYMEGRSVDEIAGRLEINPKAAESLLTRARGAFRDAFASLGEGNRLVQMMAQGENSS